MTENTNETATDPGRGAWTLGPPAPSTELAQDQPSEPSSDGLAADLPADLLFNLEALAEIISWRLEFIRTRSDMTGADKRAATGAIDCLARDIAEIADHCDAAEPFLTACGLNPHCCCGGC